MKPPLGFLSVPLRLHNLNWQQCPSWSGFGALQFLLEFEVNVPGRLLHFPVGLLPCDVERHLRDAGPVGHLEESAPPPDRGIHAPPPVATATRKVGVCRQDRFLQRTFARCAHHTTFSYDVVYRVFLFAGWVSPTQTVSLVVV